MSEDIKTQVVKLAIRYRDDDHRGFKSFTQATPGLSKVERANLLWSLIREGHEVVAGMGYAFWYALAQKDADWDGEDYLTLTRGIAEAFPHGSKKTHYGSTNCWSDGDLPGITHPMFRILEAREDDEAFWDALVAGWETLPKPYDNGLLYLLAHRKKVPLEEVPWWLLNEAARTFLKTDSPGDWIRHLPWPEAVWGEGLEKVALESDGGIKGPKVFEALVKFMDPEKMVSLVDKVDYWRTYAEVLKVPEILATTGERGKAALEAQIESLSGKITSPDWNNPHFPAFFVAFAYLGMCKAEGVAPPSSQDGFWAEFIDKLRIGWSGSSFLEYNAKLRALLAVIPPERLGPMFANASEHHWLLAGSAPTEAVIQRTVEALAAFKGQDYELRDKIAPGVMSFGAAAIPVYTRTLKGKPINNRRLLVSALGQTGSAEAVDGLVAALSDKTKGVREAAVSALIGLEQPEAVLAGLDAPMKARRKDTRLGASKVLETLPQSPERYAMASACLVKEKVADIRKILEAIPDPGSAAATDVSKRAEVLEALTASEGARWTEFADQGEPLVEIYFHYLEKVGHNQTLSTWIGPYTPWLALLAAQEDTEAVRERAVALAPLIRDYSGPDYLNALAERFDDIGAEVARRICDGQWARSPGSGKSRGSFGLSSALNWLERHAEPHAAAAFIFGLTDQRKTIHEACIERLVQLGDDAATMDEVIALLSHKKDTARACAARVLEKAAISRALPGLEVALAAEKSHRARQSLQSAVATLKNLALDVSTFPATAEGDADLDAKLATLPADPAAQIDPSKLPALTWRTGATMSGAAQGWFTAQLTREGAERKSELLRQVRTRLEDADCLALCNALLAQVTRRHDRGWALYMQPVVGGPSHIEAIGASLETLASSQSTNWGDDGVEAMVRADTDEAVRWLDHWARKTRRDALRWRSKGGLNRMAEARGISRDDLIDSAMPRFGFDAQGRQTVDYGSRTFTIALELDNRLQFFNEAGKAVKTLPAPRKSDDPAAVTAIKARVARIRKELKRITRAQIDRFEQAMCAERQWPLTTWRQRFPGHPLMRGMTQGIVFEHLPPEGDPQPFVVDDEGTTIDADDNPVDLHPEGHIRIAHPANLSPTLRSVYEDRFDNLGIRTPFDQLGRSVYTPEDVHLENERFLRELPMTSEAAFFKGLSKCGYERGGRGDAGLISDSWRTMGAWCFSLNHSGISPEVMDGGRDDTEIRSITITHNRAEVDLANLPPLAFSEVIRDLHLLTGA